MEKKRLTTPLREEDVRSLEVGDVVYLSGSMLTCRDMGHLRLKELCSQGAALPKDFHGAVLFHAGPVALKDEAGDWYVDIVGPTTSIRMEAYADFVGGLGVRALIGKGGMAEDTERACAQYGYVYFQAAPGCAAKLAEGIRKVNDVNWIELGIPEAMWDLEADCFGPLVVGIDTKGNSIYRNIREKGREQINRLYPSEG